MAAQHPSTSAQDPQEIPFWRDERKLRALAQIVSAAAIIGFLTWIAINFVIGANGRGMRLTFDFLKYPAGFPISDSVIPFDPTYTFGYAFLVGLVKTLIVAVTGIIFATVLGTLVGLARLSTNWLISRIALVYIEFHRNIPLLVLLYLWYFPVFSRLPSVEESFALNDKFFLNQRGIFLTWPRLTPDGNIFAFSVILAIVLSIISWNLLRKRQELTGQTSYYSAVGAAILILLPVAGWFLSRGAPLRLDIPYLDGYNYQGGFRLTPEFTALIIGLVMYTAAFIAEVVRAGIQAVNLGQIEAARAIGLNHFQVLNLVILPQALRIIIPPLISQYLNLTKNSSLAFFIGYQEVFSVGKIAINQAGRAIPVFALVMAAYLLMSLFTSIIMNIYNRTIQIVER